MQHKKDLNTPKSSRLSRQRIVFGILLVTSIVCITYGASSLFNRYSATHGPSTKISTQSITTLSNEPAETKPDCANYRTADADPRLIKLPSIGEEGCILKVGIDQNNAIAVPNNIHLAGWFIRSVKPGEKGVSIIDGHVSGRYSPGIFKDLYRLKTGDTFSIEFGNKDVKKFKVIDTNSYSIEETTKKMYEQAPGVERQLNLITCGGAFDKSTQQYEKRVLVTSSLIAP